MHRLTNKRTWDEAKGDITAEYGYSHIWKRLNAIENILGDDYDLDRLRVLVEAADEERVEIKPAPDGDTCGQCVHFHQNMWERTRKGACEIKRWTENREKQALAFIPFTTTRACDKFEPKIK